MKFVLPLTTTLVTITSVSSECTIPSSERWGENSVKYRPAPLTDNTGGKVYLGWLPEHQGCEEGSSSGSTITLEDGSQGWVSMYNYNYAWNVEVGMRPFWENSARGHHSKPSWYKSCPYGYERDSWWNGKCVIPSSTKFLGESCNDKYQCHNDFVEKYVDTTCSPTTNEGDGDWKCMLDEESGGGQSSSENICECIGIISCESNDCNGNQCVLSTMDMNKHCKYTDEPWLTFGTSCSNCRTSENSCEAFGGADKGSTDTSSIGIAGGVVGVGCLGLVAGANVMNKKRKAGVGGVELSQASVV